MKRRRLVVAAAEPDCPPPPSPEMNVGVMCEKASKARNGAADLIKAEALYLALRDALRETNIHIGWGVREAFLTEFAAALTMLRLGQ